MVRSLIIFCLVIFAGDVAAQQKERPMRWGFSEYAPFKIKENGAYSGIDVLLMQEVTKRMGVELEYVDCPIARCLSLMETGELDVLTALGLRDDRQVYIDYVFPPYNENNPKVFYIRKDSPVRIDRYEDIYQYLIGVKNGVRYFERFDTDPKVRKEVVNEVELNLRKLATGRIDAVINTEIQADYIIVRDRFEGLFTKAVFRDESGRDFIGISRKSPYMARRDEIARIVRELVDAGRIRGIIEEFFSQVRAAAARTPPPVSAESIPKAGVGSMPVAH